MFINDIELRISPRKGIEIFTVSLKHRLILTFKHKTNGADMNNENKIRQFLNGIQLKTFPASHLLID